jgi:hypothetical protein
MFFGRIGLRARTHPHSHSVGDVLDAVLFIVLVAPPSLDKSASLEPVWQMRIRFKSADEERRARSPPFLLSPVDQCSAL